MHSHTKYKRLLALLSFGILIAGCSDGQTGNSASTDSTHEQSPASTQIIIPAQSLAVSLAVSNAATIDGIRVTVVNEPPIVTLLTQDSEHNWTGTLNNISLGEHIFLAEALDQDGTVTFLKATKINIDAETRNIVLTLSPIHPLVPNQFTVPTIDYIRTNTLNVLLEQDVTLAVGATDPDIGDALTYTWTATAGQITTSASNGEVTWTAPSVEGPQTLTVTVMDKTRLTDSASITLNVLTHAFTVATEVTVPPVLPGRHVPSQGAYLGLVPDTDNFIERSNAPSVVTRLTQGIEEFNNTATKTHPLQVGYVFVPHGTPDEVTALKGQYDAWETNAANVSPAKQFATPFEFVQAADAAGATPILTLEPWIVDDYFTTWAAGNAAYDAITNIAQGIKAWDKPVFIRFAHEMNGHWYPWAEWYDGNRDVIRAEDGSEETIVTPTNYRLMYRNVAQIFRSIAPNAILVWCPNQGYIRAFNEPRRDLYSAWYPGDDVVDWVGVDIYERNWYQSSHPLWGGLFQWYFHHDSLDDDTTDLINESVDLYQSMYVRKGKPILIAETSAQQTYRDYSIATMPAAPTESLSAQLLAKGITIDARAASHDWKVGLWDSFNYGWIYQLYTTKDFRIPNSVPNFGGQRLMFEEGKTYALDENLPGVKGLAWFQFAKQETSVAFPLRGSLYQDAQTSIPTEDRVAIFPDAWNDFRIGYDSINKNEKDTAVSIDGLNIYKSLIAHPYFLAQLAADLPESSQFIEWAKANSINPDNPNADSDADGASNLEEFRAQTDPNNANSKLQLSAEIIVDESIPDVFRNFTVKLQWSSVGGVRYRIQYRDNVSSTWKDIVLGAETEVDHGQLGTDGTLTFIDDFTLTPRPVGTRAYRVTVVRR